MFKSLALCGLIVWYCCCGQFLPLLPYTGITLAIEAPVSLVRFLFLLSCSRVLAGLWHLCVARRHVVSCYPCFLLRSLFDINMQEWSLEITGKYFIHLPSLLFINTSMWTTFIYGLHNVWFLPAPLPSFFGQNFFMHLYLRGCIPNKSKNYISPRQFYLIFITLFLSSKNKYLPQ